MIRKFIRKLSAYANPMAAAEVICHSCKAAMCSVMVSRLVHNTEDQVLRAAEYYLSHKKSSLKPGLKKEIVCPNCKVDMPGAISIKYHWKPFPGEREMWQFNAEKKHPLIRTNMDNQIVGFINPEDGKYVKLPEPQDKETWL